MAYGIVNVKGGQGSSSSGVFMPDVTNVSVTGGSGVVNLTWTDPENVVVGGVTMATWAGTMVVRKVGSVPTSQTDGTMVLNSTVKNAHASSPFVDSSVVNGTQYFYRFFPYSGDGNYTGGTAASAKPSTKVITIPVITSTHTYNTTAQTPTLRDFDGEVMTKSGNVTETNANESTENPYQITLHLTDDEAIWSDGTYEDKVLTWNMAKATNVPTLSTTSASIGVGDQTTFTATALGTGTISATSFSSAIATAAAPSNSGSTTITVTGVGKGGTVIAVTVDEDTNYKQSTAYFNVAVVRKQIPIPIVSNTSKTYNGAVQHPTVEGEPASTYATRSGNYSATNASATPYTFTYTLTDTSLYEWDDGTSDPKSFTWTMSQATGTITLSKSTTSIDNVSTYDTITITNPSGGTLSVVTNTNSTICTTSINGTTLTITKTGSKSGTAVITVASAATTNYTASTAQITVTITHYRTMTVKIDQSNSNPASCCTYYDDATSMTAGSADWDTFFGHYPCLMAGGVEGVKLNPNNYDKDINGNSVTINSGSNDVMVAFPRRGLNISTSGNVITISMTENPNDSNFEYMAHKRGSTVKDKFYIGAYMGSEVSGKLRSLKGQTIANNKTISAFRTLARANSPASNGSDGSGYDQHGWYQALYLQCMFVLKYKTLNSQSAVGRGFVDGNSAQKATGGTETKGLDWGETTGKDHMKIFGIEDLWGNVWSWIDGIFSNSSRQILTATQGFNDTGSGYTNQGSSGFSSDSSGWLSKVQGGTHTGFVAKTLSGSETTYFCDYSYWYASRLALLGGCWDDGSYAGVFRLDVDYSASYAYAVIGSRLMFL